ncbi:Putative O-antigen transporter [Brevundimonas sp. SH203]|uniref:oligosaccharide flippase family protein n=1 Tax=Brevundimonas sp. SH203 TaxID=345167 RepID=UPI0009D4E4C9|nr:oligosaccharide flippase family protein [Brevundimonas sp. SH203]GAW40334.1 Putative O-antigen transporter [Brevundimonas sp. SH203]
MADAGWLYVAHIARYAAPLLLYPVLTRRLGIEGFGVYAAGLSLALIVSVVVDYGLSVSGPRDIAARPADRGEIVGRAVAVRVLLAPLAVCVGLCLSALTPVPGGATGATAVAILLGVGQGAGLLWYFQGIGNPAPMAMREVGFMLAAALIILAWPGLGVAGALAMQAAGVWCGVAVGVVGVWRRERIARPSWSSVVAALRDGGPLFLSRAVIAAYTGAAVFAVAVLAGPAQAALYGVADRLVSAAGSLMRPLAGVIAPRIAGLLTHDPVAAFRTARWTLIGVFGAAAVVAAGLTVAAPMLMRGLFGAGFMGAKTPLRLLAATLPLVAISQVLGLHLMTSLRMDGRFAAMTAAGCAATLGAAWALAPAFGAVGMAGARIVGEAAVVVICAACLKGHWGALFPARSRHVPAV